MQFTKVTPLYKPLLKPQIDENPLLQLLQQRKSSRAFSPQPLPDQVLSNLLWAAFGISRPDTGMRTAPSAVNFQEIDVYVASAAGLLLYQPGPHQLLKICDDDLRAATGFQDFVPVAPVNLVYVADYARIDGEKFNSGRSFPALDVGFISENVYLYCASAGLATVVRASIDRSALAQAMNLRADQEIILAQTVGYPPQENLS